MREYLEHIAELQSAAGSKKKLAVIERYKDDGEFRTFLYYALNPLCSYRLSEKTLRGDEEDSDELQYDPNFFDGIFGCCEYLSRLRGIDDATVRQVRSMLANEFSPEERELCIGLLSKTIRLGVTAKTVNKVIPDLIPEWEVQQAFPFEKYPIQHGLEFWLTQKLNGVRATFYHDELVARSGVPYTGLDHIIAAIGRFADAANLVFDGELTLKDKGELSDNEAFRVATGILNSDAENKTEICYTIFDAIPLSEFENSNPATPYSRRREILDQFQYTLNTDCTAVLPVLYHGNDQSKIWSLLDRMVEEDKEGLMLNIDVPYYRNRHRGILKVKQFYTMDLPIVRCEEGSGRHVGKLGAFVLRFEDNEVKVGSGFTDAERETFWSRRDEMEGLLCEVKYKEISSDKNTGLKSLQFPVFVSVREDKQDVSYG